MDFEEGAVIVAECSYEGHASAPKTRASRRKVFVDTPAIEALSRARPTDANPESLVFCRIVAQLSIRTTFGTECWCRRARGQRFPRCRGTIFATRIPLGQIRGESIKALQAQLGHTDSRLTLSVYTQPMPEAQKLLACKISSVLLCSAPKSEVQQAETEVVIP